MPLSKCRICGKKIPNPYRPYHEKHACRKMKEEKGLLLHEALPKVKVEPKPLEDKCQKRLYEVAPPPH